MKKWWQRSAVLTCVGSGGLGLAWGRSRGEQGLAGMQDSRQKPEKGMRQLG